MRAKKYTVEDLQRIIAPIAKKYQISAVYLFGSYARGDNDNESDIDLRIDKGQLKGLFALGGFYNDVQEALGMDIDVVTTGGLDDDFLNSIRKDEVQLYAA
ncbi:MAG: nucleotidyltransferase [Clostridiales bacterium]|jgi:predicted nucleotidyltransferase|nr:nucleotidyltransferase [Clostridiales bacterium]